jgi:hypothetical protein
MDGACSTRPTDQKCVQNNGMKTRMEQSLGKPRRKW